MRPFRPILSVQNASSPREDMRVSEKLARAAQGDYLSSTGLTDFALWPITASRPSSKRSEIGNPVDAL